jgi:hypothetical protein
MHHVRLLRRFPDKASAPRCGASSAKSRVNRYGFVRGQRCDLEAEPGLSRQRVSIWVDEGDLHIEYKEPLRAWYRCAQVCQSC